MMQNLHVNRPLLLSVVCVGIAAIVLLVPLPGLVAAMFTTSLGQEGAGDNMPAYLATHETDLKTYRQRFDGRSLFSRPPAPPIAAPPPLPTVEIPDAPKPDPARPAGRPVACAGAHAPHSEPPRPLSHAAAMQPHA